jgi:hypothetical protein
MKLENRLGIYLVVSICIIFIGYALLIIPSKYILPEIIDNTIGHIRLLTILTIKVIGFLIGASGILMFEKHFTSKL